MCPTLCGVHSETFILKVKIFFATEQINKQTTNKEMKLYSLEL